MMTRAISGRPARCLANRFTRLAETIPDSDVPSYPITYDLGKALHAAGKAKGEFGFGAQWAGQGAPLSRPMPAAELVKVLARNGGGLTQWKRAFNADKSPRICPRPARNSRDLGARHGRDNTKRHLGT